MADAMPDFVKKILAEIKDRDVDSLTPKDRVQMLLNTIDPEDDVRTALLSFSVSLAHSSLC